MLCRLLLVLTCAVTSGCNSLPEKPEPKWWLAKKQLRDHNHSAFMRTLTAMVNDHPDFVKENLNEFKLLLSARDVLLERKAVPVKPKSAIEKRLNSIVIPKVEFDNTPVTTVFEYLKNRSRVLDPERAGVSFVTVLNAGYHTLDDDDEDDDDEDDDDEWVADDDDDDGGDGLGSRIPCITLRAENMPLGELVRLVCRAAKLELKVEDYAAIILGPGVARGPCNILHMYHIPDGELFGKRLHNQINWKAELEARGVEFPELEDGDRAIVSFDEGTRKLIVRNTWENVKRIEIVLKRERPASQARLHFELIQGPEGLSSKTREQVLLTKGVKIIDTFVLHCVPGKRSRLTPKDVIQELDASVALGKLSDPAMVSLSLILRTGKTYVNHAVAATDQSIILPLPDSAKYLICTVQVLDEVDRRFVWDEEYDKRMRHVVQLLLGGLPSR